MSMVETFLKAVGFDPDEFATACVYYKKEFEGMKAGVVQAVQHFGNETRELRAANERVEAQLRDLDAKLSHFILTFQQSEVKPNGHDIERHDIDSSGTPYHEHGQHG